MRKYHVWIFVLFFSGFATFPVSGFRMDVKVSKGFIYQAFGKTQPVIYADKSSNPAIAVRGVFFMNKRNITQSIVELAAAKLVISF